MEPTTRKGGGVGAKASLGSSIDAYEVLDLLGKGSYACVYRGRCKTSGLEVAIKMIDKEAMRAAKMVKRVKNEVEIHCQLKHPSILELFNYFEDSNYVYLVLEMCESGELHRYLRDRGQPISEDEARRMVGQIVKGLEYLHGYNIIHRDLKLANVLLTKNMDVKIADFGLATRLAQPGDKHMTMCGTPNFIAPEIVSRRPHGLESDLWSLGVIIFTMLVGKPPFDSKKIKTTFDKVTRAEYTLPDTLSPEASDLISLLLQTNPTKRLSLQQVARHPFLQPNASRQTHRSKNPPPPSENFKGGNNNPHASTWLKDIRPPLKELQQAQPPPPSPQISPSQQTPPPQAPMPPHYQQQQQHYQRTSYPSQQLQQH
eukprot:comp70165_c0_seq1/m.48102 comp70165_c0_seq1/g.48102  ORF comp70165_c0_seq1/g.48102 comp70165_c0_seq1/m.48102 type:complete len:371 (-) comp70165_c0_seq1:50-1162(-)